MSKVSLNQITHNARNDFLNLLKKSWNCVQTYEKKYSGTDVRSHFFIVFAELNLWLLIQLDSFSEMLDNNTDRISRYMNLNPNSRLMFLSQYDTINRASYCTHAMFEVEDFLKLIGLKVGMKPTNKYGLFIEEFLKRIDKYDGNTILILKSPAHIRNSLHNNGYASYDFELLVGNNLYKFVKDQQVYYTGWDNLYLMFDRLIDKIVEIIDSPKIQIINQIPH